MEILLRREPIASELWTAPDTKPDANVGQGFSADSIVSSAYLAPTLWALGHIERARELINAATRRAAEIDVPAIGRRAPLES